MPHFSPISWLITGFIFYMLLCLFISLFWWIQNVKFPSSLSFSSSNFDCSWNWSWWGGWAYKRKTVNLLTD